MKQKERPPYPPIDRRAYDRCVIDASDKNGVLAVADTNSVGIIKITVIADVDIVIASNILSSERAQADVVTSSGVGR